MLCHTHNPTLECFWFFFLFFSLHVDWLDAVQIRLYEMECSMTWLHNGGRIVKICCDRAKEKISLIPPNSNNDQLRQTHWLHCSVYMRSVPIAVKGNLNWHNIAKHMITSLHALSTEYLRQKLHGGHKYLRRVGCLELWWRISWCLPFMIQLSPSKKTAQISNLRRVSPWQQLPATCMESLHPCTKTQTVISILYIYLIPADAGPWDVSGGHREEPSLITNPPCTSKEQPIDQARWCVMSS